MPYNNFIYKIDFASPISSQSFKDSSQPFTTVPAEGTSTFIFRLSNPNADGVNNTNRVENEVAALFLCRQTLSMTLEKYSDIVPGVYDWKPYTPNTDSSTSDESDFGWIMMQFRPGVPLDSQFDKLLFSEKKTLVAEIAAIFAVIQGMSLPAGVGAYGSLTVKDGDIVSGQPTIATGGPWEQYRDWWAGMLSMALSQAERSPVLKGWRENGIRDRVDRLIDTGIQTLLAPVDTSKRALIHGDFSKYLSR